MGVLKAINTAREAGTEAVKRIPTGAETKNKIIEAINSGVQCVKGREHIVDQLRDTRDTVIELPTGIVSNTAQACGNLCSGHPIDAVCSATRVLTDSCKDAAKIIASPVSMTSTIVRKTANTTAKGLQIPIRAAGTVTSGIKEVANEILGGAPTANDNTSASPASAPPPPPSSSEMADAA